MRTSKCAGCGAEIIWTYTEQGKRMPLDAAPMPETPIAPGAYRIAGEVCHAAEPMFDPPGTVYYLNHWATCPQAEQFRAAKGRGR